MVSLAKEELVQVKQRYYCHCMMEDGSELYLVARTTDMVKASRKIHRGYQVEFVIDVLTEGQMEARKRHLKRSLYAGHSLMYK